MSIKANLLGAAITVFGPVSVVGLVDFWVWAARLPEMGNAARGLVLMVGVVAGGAVGIGVAVDRGGK